MEVLCPGLYTKTAKDTDPRSRCVERPPFNNRVVYVSQIFVALPDVQRGFSDIRAVPPTDGPVCCARAG